MSTRFADVLAELVEELGVEGAKAVAEIKHLRNRYRRGSPVHRDSPEAGQDAKQAGREDVSR